ncbi:hypothetical protein FLAG1_09644 [Fusarium langsethiae]|uniref:Involucrin repeat protein n=1 Tax=Fusarium langsethiae TaxID=179993 RepID=A0A0N0DC13_FUSLA|nr:hypothetical protein FLAG1_09644 [Fusarium langsethiae]GKU06047.1 unnamed protein product [Fusarium langsethiae]GKU20198.1 unnamed protein product [Fusarium langsethiae]
MNNSEKRRPGTGNPSTHTLRTGASNNNSSRTSMPAMPAKVAMAATTNATPEETHETSSSNSGGAPLKEKESTTTGTNSTKEKDRDKERKERREKREKERGLEAALKEKDEKIAYLEKEMGIMEREFHRELDKLSQNESETATFWQAKHSALNQQYLRTDTELRLLRAEVEVREGEREELREGWEVLRRELKERDDEIRGLRGQVRGLKEWVSNSTRTDGQECDEVFGDGMARLGNGLQNWVIVNFRKAKINLKNLDEATLAEISELVPMYEELALSHKVYLLQSIVSRILVGMVFDAYFVGLTEEQTQQFRQLEKLLSSYADSDEAINHWRSSTLALLRRDSSSLKESTSSVTEVILKRVTRLLDALCGTTSSEARDSGLRVLVNNSVELARLVSVQKAVLRVNMPIVLPHQRIMFESETMEDLGGEDEESLTGREICCVAFPGVIKHGDEHGGHLQYRNVILKARVLCSPEQ